MQRLAIEALKHKYAAEMADAEFVLSIYLKRAVGVGEHPGLLEDGCRAGKMGQCE